MLGLDRLSAAIRKPDQRNATELDLARPRAHIPTVAPVASARADEREELTMGMLVVTEFISLDGVIDDPGGSEGTEHGGWTFRFPAPE